VHRDGVAIGAYDERRQRTQACVAYRFGEDFFMPLVAVQYVMQIDVCIVFANMWNEVVKVSGTARAIGSSSLRDLCTR